MSAVDGIGRPRVRPSDKLQYYADDDLIPVQMRERCRHLECARNVFLDEVILVYQFLRISGLAETFMEWRDLDSPQR